ncbi:MAG TPA: hypothetical protein VGC56_18445 [Allosphingosinicella sp.]
MKLHSTSAAQRVPAGSERVLPGVGGIAAIAYTNEMIGALLLAAIFAPLGLAVAPPLPPPQKPRRELPAEVAAAPPSGEGYQPPAYHDGKAHYEKSETSLGRFTVVRYVEDCRDVPMLDFGCWLTKEAQLRWRDSSDRIGFEFVDNGRGVRFRAEGRSAQGGTVCIMQPVLVGYDPKPSTIENWRKLQPFIGEQLRACEAISRADLNRALGEMANAAADYAAAAKAWKSVSVELFGPNGSRCVAERAKAHTMPPRFECTRYSKP